MFYLRSRRAERRVCENADAIVANTDELAAQFRSDYARVSSRVVTITNGFDGVDVADLTGVTAPAEPSGQFPVNLEHFGTVYGQRSPVALLNAAADVLGGGHEIRGRLVIRFTGQWDISDVECEVVARRLEEAGILVRQGQLPHEACIRKMMKATALLALQPDSPLQVPAKIFEYVAVGRPVVLVGGDGATRGLVERHRLGAYFPNERGSLRQLCIRLAGRDADLLAPPATASADFDYVNLTRKLAGILDAVCTVRR